MKRYAIVVAGGKGLRMGSDIPKQFLTVQGRPLLMLTLENFHSFDSSMPLILVLPESQQEYWARLCHEYLFRVPHTVVSGGETRFHSVRNGLKAIIDNRQDSSSAPSQAQFAAPSSALANRAATATPACQDDAARHSAGDEALVAVHDGVRPFVSHDVITSCFETAAHDGAAVPVIPVVETLREVRDDGTSFTVPRSRYRLVQTPQTFRLSLLAEAYGQPYTDAFTDDASVVEALGHPVTLVDGNRENIKITTPYDLAVAETL